MNEHLHIRRIVRGLVQGPIEVVGIRSWQPGEFTEVKRDITLALEPYLVFFAAGEYHREDGPAVFNKNGDKKFYIGGRPFYTFGTGRIG